MAKITGVLKTIDNMQAMRAAVDRLSKQRVLVGVPAEDTARDGGGITNAALAYIHEKGAPEANIPARPFLAPGVQRVRAENVSDLKKAGELALEGKVDAVDRQFHRVGLRTQNSVRNVIREGVPPPLADSTLAGRARRGRKGASKELAARRAGAQPGIEFAKPLIDTGQLLRAITYVVRRLGKE